MNRRRSLVVCGLLLACASSHAQQPQVTVITGATLIDGTARPALQDSVVVIDGTRIGQIDPVDPARPLPLRGRGPR